MAEDLLGNTIIAIIIILLIVYGIPSIVYLFISISKGGPEGRKVETLLDNFKINSDNPNTMNYNSLNDEYFLFCTYMPIKKLVFCDNGRNKKILEENDRDLKIVTEIFQKIKGIKEFCDNEYDRIKEKSDEKISENKAAREEREHEEELLRKKEEGENSRYDSTSRREWIKNIFTAIYSSISLAITTLTNVSQIAVKIGAIFGQLGKALLGNYVVMGFLILIFCILVVLSVLKYRSIDTTTKGGGDNYKANNGISFSPFSIYDDMLDTYSYYSKIANNFNVSDYTDNILGNNNDENNGYEDDSETIDRVQLYGGKYDNLSYLKLYDFGITNIDDGSSKNNIKTEKDKYYNIYLPSEKFKDDSVEQISSLSWNIYESSKKEKIWKLDCESIDTIVPDDNTRATFPAFITDGDKCIINRVGFNKLGEKDGSLSTDSDKPSTIFTTEYIK
jgi:hypothetical protein